MLRHDHFENLSALEFHKHALSKVSRTFALTIPQLPAPVRHVIGNAYLLCRIADTIEDEPTIDAPNKALYLRRFAEVVHGKASAKTFASDLTELLSAGTNLSEKELAINAPTVVDFHRNAPQTYRDPVDRCLKIMCEGMSDFVGTGSNGLASMQMVDQYCYCVAGVVGEMITDVLCSYSGEIAKSRDELFPLSSRFGKGLQFVNIIKDHPEDAKRGVRWLPRVSLHRASRSNSAEQSTKSHTKAFIHHTVEVAQSHLEAAVRYTLLIPNRERAIRRFLGWTLGLAVLTLRRIHANPLFSNGDEVKISRGQVYAVIATINVMVRSDRALRSLFQLVSPVR